MKQHQKIIGYMTAGTMAILLCVIAVIPVFSMGFSAVSGALAYGAAPLRAGSQIEVEFLRVDVDVPKAPENLYENEQGIWENYTVVTSRYSLYNASERSVTEVMAVPFGALPDYTYDEDDSSPVLPKQGAYEITFKGQSITPVVRHSLARQSQRNDQYRVMNDSAWHEVQPLNDSKLTDQIYYPEQTVSVYTYRVSNPLGVDGQDFKLVSKSFGAINTTATRLYTDQGGESESRLLSNADEDGEDFCVYVIGQDVGELQWKAVSWGDEYSFDSVTVSLQGKKETTFASLAMEYYTPDCGASEVDWYNAVYAAFVNGYAGNGVVDMMFPPSHDISDYLQGWQLFEITLEPYEHAELITKTPAFPDILNWTEPYMYEFGYDLLGLSRFKDVKKVEFFVNTPCYTLENSSYYHVYQVPVGEKSLTLDKIECDVIVCTLCAEQEPANVLAGMVYGALGAVLLVVLAVAALCSVVVVGVILIVFFVLKKVKGKRMKGEDGKSSDMT